MTVKDIPMNAVNRAREYLRDNADASCADDVIRGLLKMLERPTNLNREIETWEQVAAMVGHERERCAMIADEIAFTSTDGDGETWIAKKIAAKIRGA